MKVDLMKLLDAQDIDLEIDGLMKSKEDYPQQMEDLKKEISDLEVLVEGMNEKVTENKKKRGVIESELLGERELLTQKETRLLDTKTNKEYNAVQKEIEQARERIDSMETEDLELMAEIDTLVPEREEAEKKLAETSKINNAEYKAIEKKFNSIESDIDSLDKKRSALLDDIQKRGMTVYLRLRKGKGGLAVAKVDQVKHSCRGCNKQLPPQKVLEVRRSNKLLFCENCGRILIWDARDEEK